MTYEPNSRQRPAHTTDPTPPDKKHYRAKLFKSGNSLALRIPAGTKLVAGMEMDLTIENGERLSLAPIDRPKRKFNIEKVAGSATGLKMIKDEDRIFEDVVRPWDDPDWPGWKSAIE